MGEKVVSLCEPEADATMIQMVGELTKRVNEAEIVDMFVVTRDRGGGITTYRHLEEENLFTVLGYLEWAKWCLEERIGKEPSEQIGKDPV